MKRLGLIVVTFAFMLPVVPASAARPERAALPKCPLGALDKAPRPVDITFWHSMARANEETLQRLTDQFNASQADVRVKLVNQTDYRTTLDKFVAGLSTGDLPDLVQMEDAALQQMIDSRSVLPAQACVKADRYDLSDHVPRVLDYFTVKKTLWAMPFNVSSPVLLYNKTAFAKAGLDPNRPPATLDELKADAQKITDSGVVTKAAFGFRTSPGLFEQWLAKADAPYVNHGNGRKSRATRVQFDEKAGRQVFAWISDMARDGLAAANPDEGGNAFDNLLGVGSGNFAMSIDTSATLGTITQILATGAFPEVELGVAPMPGLQAKGGLSVGGAGLYLSNKSSPAKQAAAWEFAKFLNQPDVQATWVAGTGYAPVRESAVALPEVQQLWARTPGYKVAYDQLVNAATSSATVGPVIGDYEGVRDAVRNAISAMFSQGTSPTVALRQAQRAADAAIAQYNKRVT